MVFHGKIIGKSYGFRANFRKPRSDHNLEMKHMSRSLRLDELSLSYLSWNCMVAWLSDQM